MQFADGISYQPSASAAKSAPDTMVCLMPVDAPETPAARGEEPAEQAVVHDALSFKRQVAVITSIAFTQLVQVRVLELSMPQEHANRVS